MRELTPEECEFIAGGTYTGEYGTPPPPIVVIASPPYYPPPYYPPPAPPPYLPPAPSYGGGGGGGGGGGDVDGSDRIDVDDGCPVEQGAAESALDTLYDKSPTARGLIDAAAGFGVEISIITANLAGFGAQAQFVPSSSQILWDPFLVVTGVNSNGSTYTMPPIMVLAHELVHAAHANNPAYQGADSEPLIMQIANQVAAELNAATGSTYSANRDNHEHTSLYNSTSPTSTGYSIARPGCN